MSPPLTEEQKIVHFLNRTNIRLTGSIDPVGGWN